MRKRNSLTSGHGCISRGKEYAQQRWIGNEGCHKAREREVLVGVHCLPKALLGLSCGEGGVIEVMDNRPVPVMVWDKSFSSIGLNFLQLASLRDNHECFYFGVSY